MGKAKNMTLNETIKFLAGEEHVSESVIASAYNSNIKVEDTMQDLGIKVDNKSATRIVCAHCKVTHELGSLWLKRGTIKYISANSQAMFLVCQACLKDLGDNDTWIAWTYSTAEKPPVPPSERRMTLPIYKYTSGGKSVTPEPVKKEETKEEFLHRFSQHIRKSVRSTFTSTCSGNRDHLDFLGLPKWTKGQIKGDLILSASWAKGAKAHPQADAAVFFADAWRSKFKPTQSYVTTLEQTWQKGSNGLEWPSVKVKYSGSDEAWAKDAPIIYINWPDHGVLPISFIEDYVQAAADMIRDGHNVQVGCIGGHGRTGTFAALVVCNLFREIYPNFGAKEALNWVRFFYCGKAAETAKQEDMIFEYNEEEPPPAAIAKPTTYGAQSSFQMGGGTGATSTPSPAPASKSQTLSGGGGSSSSTKAETKPNPHHSYVNHQ